VEYATHVWSPNTKHDIFLIERVQKRATKCIKDMEKLTYEERLGSLKLAFLENCRIVFDLVQVFKMIKGFSAIDFNKFLFSIIGLLASKLEVII